MNRTGIISIITALTLFACTATAQPGYNAGYTHSSTEPGQDHIEIRPENGRDFQSAARQRASTAATRINLFIFSKEKKFNLASTVFRLQASITSLFKRNLFLIKVGSLEEMARKTDVFMASHPDIMIGHLWIDSHGKYKKGYALFNVGADTMHANNILDPRFRLTMERMTAYCDEQSNVTIGSCYGAADYNRPANDKLEQRYMNGDTLMLHLAHIFAISPVYASQSWVMVKPFMFGSRWGLSGFPLERKFMDEIYRPVWERLGEWKMVPAGSQEIKDVKTLYLSAGGELKISENSYQSVSRHKKKMERRIKNLKPGMYKLDRKS